MKSRILATLLGLSLLIGCSIFLNINGNDIEPLNDVAGSGNVAIDFSDSDAAGKAYCELKAEFESKIELVKQEAGEEHITWDAILKLVESRNVFEEMIQYRHSLDDFNELTEFSYHNYGGKISIKAEPIFTSGKTSYRILTFGADNLPMVRVYIQIYDKEFFETQCVYTYQVDAGIGGELVYCGFQQDFSGEYLIIIHRERDYVTESDSYYLANYKLLGNNINNYYALKEDIFKGKWRVNKYITSEESISFETKTTKIFYTLTESELYNPDHNIQASFRDNKLKIILNNEADEVSLLFKEGFWEVLD